MLGLLAISPGSICYESCLSSLSLWFWKNFSSPVACRHSATTSVLGSWMKVDDQSLLVKLLSFNIVLSTQKCQIYIYVWVYIYIYLVLCTVFANLHIVEVLTFFFLWQQKWLNVLDFIAASFLCFHKLILFYHLALFVDFQYLLDSFLVFTWIFKTAYKDVKNRKHSIIWDTCVETIRFVKALHKP